MTTTAEQRDQVRVTLPDGSVREVPAGTTVLEFAKSIGPGLAKAALAGKVDGRVVDLASPLEGDAAVEIVTERSPEALELLRAAGIRAELDDRNETLNYRIREAETQKVPYMAVVGGREAEGGDGGGPHPRRRAQAGRAGPRRLRGAGAGAHPQPLAGDRAGRGVTPAAA